MPVDEFGREIPAEVQQQQQRRRRSGSPRGGGGGAPSSYAAYQPSAPSYYQSGPYHPANDLVVANTTTTPTAAAAATTTTATSLGPSPSAAASAERAPLYHGRGPPHGGGGGGHYRGGRSGGGGYHHRGGGGGGRGSPGWRHYRSSPYGPSNNKSFFGGRSSNTNNSNAASGVGGVGTTAAPPTPAQPHPSTRYISSPMLCGYLWKQEHQKENQAGKEDTEKANDNADDDDTKNDTENDTSAVNDETNQDSEENKESSTLQEESSATAREDTDAAYTNYRRSYCENYLKHVFNAHLDDSWFRQLYSPLDRFEVSAWEKKRAQQEATYLAEEVAQWQANDLKDITLATTLGLTVETAPRTPPRFHVPRAIQEGRLIQVQQVPPHVTNTQLWHALPPASAWIAHANTEDGNNNNNNTPDAVLQLISSMPLQTHHNRTVYWLAPNRATADALWQAFLTLDGRSATSATEPVAGAAAAPATWEVDCPDPYRRTEYDVDGRGGAPEDGLGVPDRKAPLTVSPYQDTTAVSVLSMALSQPSRIPADFRAATTLARALDVQQHVTAPLDSLLEAAEVHFANETETAAAALRLDLALAYLRRVHGVNFYKGCQRAEFWGDVLAGHEAASSLQCRSVITPEEEEEMAAGQESMEASKKEEEGADVKQEDDNSKGENPNGEENMDGGETSATPAAVAAALASPAKDLLVQRLDDAIEHALNVTCHEWIAAADAVVDATTDAAAEDLRRAEEDAEEDWLRHHSIDDEGRARCSFHFCHKLFKDENFLRKHLKKKHYEYCKAEQAKCHDSYMMKAWEGAGASRPRPVSSSLVGPPRLIVPDVMVDCGTKYGCIPAPLYHVSKEKPGRDSGEHNNDEEEEENRDDDSAVIVDVVDPEPALWQKEQEHERIEKEKRQAAEEMRQRRREESRQQRMPSSTPRKKEFVDVDDMKEDEVVTMTFDQVELPQPKKKKKKRKLL